MPSRLSRVVRSTAAALIIAAVSAAPVWAQQPDSAADQRLLKDFIHYVNIDQYEQAIATGKALVDRGMKAADFAALVEASGEAGRFQSAAIKAGRRPEVEAIAGQLLKAFEKGKLDQARDAGEISKNIGMLTGTSRQRLLAIDRLNTAGEYAMPQLLQALVQRKDAVLAAEVRNVIVDLGRQAIVPLTTAAAGLDESSQELVVGLLGDIPYPSSLPFLYELRADSKSNAVQQACVKSIRRIAGAFDPAMSPSALYMELAEGYYAESPSLTSFPGEPDQLMWSFDPGLGLMPTAIKTEVYHEAMAMRASERSLKLDGGNAEAMALWLASNFRREIETPAGYANPAYGADRRDAMYYAVAAGSTASQRVLARAEDGHATQLSRRAIAAIEKTAGTTGMAETVNGRRPLLEALRYPDRRVQYEAAMAVGSAQPKGEFEGAERVVPILGSAVRDASARYAVVLASTQEVQSELTDTLKAKGFDVRVAAGGLGDAQQAIAEAPGIDLIVLAMSSAKSTDSTITEIRGTTKIAATPVLALADLNGVAELGPKYMRDQTVRVARIGLGREQITTAANQLLQTAAGGAISQDEARAYKTRALGVLRDLAVSGNTTLNVADASPALVTSLTDNTGEMRLGVAEVLSYVNDKKAQVALMDAALGASGDERVAMLTKTAGSAKRFGNLLEPRQIMRVMELTKTAKGDEATAAAALMGALNLPNADVVPLILNEKTAKN